MASMTELEREMVTVLCARIADEKNPLVFPATLNRVGRVVGKVEESSGKALWV
jgi:hypothetical protein